MESKVIELSLFMYFDIVYHHHTIRNRWRALVANAAAYHGEAPHGGVVLQFVMRLAGGREPIQAFQTLFYYNTTGV